MKYLLLTLFYFVLLCPGNSQCIFELEQPIPVDADFFSQGSVYGLINDDLSANQSLCGVTINFKHEFIGNLVIELISPSGQVVTLIGSQQISSFTNGTEWDITLLPCANPVSPDPGFMDMWSNGQPWTIGATYNGSYYPNSGCLEDFNTGSANGIWQLHILNGAFYSGEIISFGLIFCDPAGISCQPCVADAGSVVNDSLVFCKNDPVLAAYVPEINFSNGIPDQNFYFYKYIIVLNGIITQVTDDPDWTLLAPGSYMIYGVSYLQAYDQTILNTIGDNIITLQNLFNSTTICGKISVPISFTINPSYDLPVKDVIICKNDTFNLAGNEYFESRFIRDTFPTANGCDSIVNINLIVAELTLDILSDTIDCDHSVITLDTINSSFNVPGYLIINYEWKDPNGMVISSNGSIQVNSGGNYSLEIVVLSGTLICNYQFEVTVKEIVFPPELPVLNAAKPCAGLETLFYLQKDTLRTSAHWTFTGDPEIRYVGDSVYVKWLQTGNYTACVYGLNDCGSSDTVCIEVIVNTTPVFSFETDSITCDRSITINVSGAQIDLNWSSDASVIPINVSNNGSVISGQILDPNLSASLNYSGSINGCDLNGVLDFEVGEYPNYEGIFDTVVCGSARILFTIDHDESKGIIYYTYQNNQLQAPLTTNANTIQIDVQQNEIFIVDSISNQYNTCTLAGPDTFYISVVDPPSITVPDTITLCNQFNEDGEPKYFLDDFILTGDKNGTWNIGSLTGVTIVNDSIDLTNLNAGIYVINYKTNEAVAPCQDLNFSVTIKVIDCFCPPAADIFMIPELTFCSNYGTIDLDSLFNPSTVVEWFEILSNGSELLISDGNLKVPADISSSLNIKMKTLSDWHGACPDSLVLNFNFIQSRYAGDDAVIDHCYRSERIIDLDTLLNNVRNAGIWIADPPNYPGVIQGFNPTTHVLNLSRLGAGSFQMYSIAESRSVCVSDTAILRIKVNPLPVINIQSSGFLDCTSRESKILINGDKINSYNVSWYFGGNEFYHSTGIDSQLVDQPGKYNFVIEDQLTGCIDSSSLVVENFSDSINDVNYNIITNCSESMADLFIQEIIGGSAPFRYSVDMQPYTTFTQFYGLEEGPHFLEIIDSKNCTYEIDFDVTSGNGFLLDLGDDEHISIGDSVIYDIKFPENFIRDISIYIDGELISSKDPTGILTPDKSILLKVILTDINGCTYIDEKRIFVDSENEIYIPNVFSPNNDGKNDFFFVPSNPAIEKLLSLNIYDRWGNHVYGVEDILTGETDTGWDGKFHGKEMNPGVFVYYLKYRSPDQTQSTLKGHITLIR